MDTKQSLDRKYETIAWGLLLVWWGLRWWPLVSLPDGIGMLGTCLILLGLNAVRTLNGIPARGSTTILALIALVWGGVELANSTLHLPFKLPVFEILIILWGLILLGRELLKTRRDGLEDAH